LRVVDAEVHQPITKQPQKIKERELHQANFEIYQLYELLNTIVDFFFG